MQTIYIEESITHHPRVQRILDRFNSKRVIPCQHYGEVFNRKNQNFRLQKNQPALILAEKKGRKILPTPPGFGIGGQHNYYFSHLLNCPFDCEYCFLQGMYRSAHHVLFINFEDFMHDIITTTSEHNQPCYFFSGYDGDSLALEPTSHFLQEFIPFFATQPQAILELRTKSANISQLLKQQPIANCVVAFSLTPAAIADKVEHKTASIEKRIRAIKKLAEHGYRIGLRLDPLIYAENFTELYRDLITDLAAAVPAKALHSISIGVMRFPQKMFHTIKALHPNSTLLNQPLERKGNIISYPPSWEQAMTEEIRHLLQKHFNPEIIFQCRTED